MTKKNHPSVGIGLPVYNNGRHLSKTLDSIVNQSYTNLIIYISDDCSHDDTQAICERYAGKDDRIRYSRNERNMGTNRNHAKILSLASTEYFMFARGHEVLSLNLVEDCLRTLQENGESVLSFATTQWIDEQDNPMPDKPIAHFDTRGLDVVTRSALVFWGNWECFYGLARTELLKRIRGHEEIIGNDTVSLLEKALLGSFAHVGSATRYRRYHYTGESYAKRMRRYQTQNYRQLNAIDKLFPLARLPYHLLRSVLKSKLRPADKIKILFVVLSNAPLRYIVSKGKQL